ncbi:galactose oxidase [Suillus placidus]|uniref:Galactose oxidase n=1 Tax=Suillus placidus TaxID=48579 RepID=A0A9P7CW77_9AGAM|nr:galactose oxidase [Suillus placidus]
MGNEKKNTSKAAAKAAKKQKAEAKTSKKEKKKSKKTTDAPSEDEDLEAILDKMNREWEDAHKVTEELVEGPPSRRANATLTPCPSGNYLWCIGGEFFSDDGKAYFYNDVYRYNPDKDEWRKFVSPTCPGPRSAHAVVASAAGGGKLFLFGGEFSSLHQNTFHHYRDFWCFDISTHSWDRLDTKIRPTARSGHRMAMWKHYIVLFGGFYDPGHRTQYLNDTWVFDTQEYKWRQIEFKDIDRKPSARSGFSFLSTPEGIVLHGGYCKEYIKGKRPMGIMLDDTWFLRMSLETSQSPPLSAVSSDSLGLKWERRKKPSFAPHVRSGCTMSLWSAKGIGVLFGGVTDDDRDEESLESVFWNDLYGYQLAGNGRWQSMLLKKLKKAGRGGKRKVAAIQQGEPPVSDGDDDGVKTQEAKNTEVPDVDPDDPILTAPMPRYNAMLAVLKNTLYIYGGIFERGSREYTLDDFYLIQLDKLERYTCLKHSGIVIPAEGDESSSDEDVEGVGSDEDDEGVGSDEDGDGDNETWVGEDDAVLKLKKLDESHNDEGADKPIDMRVSAHMILFIKHHEVSAQATAFMGVSKDTARSAEDVISTPELGETLALFYARSREYWTQKAHGVSDNRGKQLRRDGFSFAEERYAEYKPILKEVEKILAEAGLDEDEMRAGAAQTGAGGGIMPSRNRR